MTALVLLPSPGWGVDVFAGEGLARVYGDMREIAANARHKSRLWHELRSLRSYGFAPSTMHRLVHRLHALGVVWIDPVRGCQGVIRFTFGVAYWHRGPIRRGQLARMLGRAQVSFGQLALELTPPVAYPLTTPPDHAAGGLGSLPSLAGGTATGQLTLELPRSFEELMARHGSGRRVLGW